MGGDWTTKLIRITQEPWLLAQLVKAMLYNRPCNTNSNVAIGKNCHRKKPPLGIEPRTFSLQD